MNSRDAAYEESVQQLLETTAAEAAALNGDNVSNRAGSVVEEAVDDMADFGPSGRKKRKRVEEEPYVFQNDLVFLRLTPHFECRASSKRKRSASVISERLVTTAQPDKVVEVPPSIPDLSALLPPPAPPTGGKSRVKRGGRKNAITNETAPSVDGEEGTRHFMFSPTAETYDYLTWTPLP